MARSTASTAIFPAKAGAWAFQVEISPLRDWRVAVVVCRPWPMAWKIVSTGRPSRVPIPAAAEGPRWATWSILWACRQIAFTRSTCSS